jgi:hypothetical protein
MSAYRHEPAREARSEPKPFSASPSRKEESMKPLLEQLSDLAARAKWAKDAIATAGAKDRAALKSERDRLKSSLTTVHLAS